jgi:hypothetical protein
MFVLAANLRLISPLGQVIPRIDGFGHCGRPLLPASQLPGQVAWGPASGRNRLICNMARFLPSFRSVGAMVGLLSTRGLSTAATMYLDELPTAQITDPYGGQVGVVFVGCGGLLGWGLGWGRSA